MTPEQHNRQQLRKAIVAALEGMEDTVAAAQPMFYQHWNTLMSATVALIEDVNATALANEALQREVKQLRAQLAEHYEATAPLPQPMTPEPRT